MSCLWQNLRDVDCIVMGTIEMNEVLIKSRSIITENIYFVFIMLIVLLLHMNIVFGRISITYFLKRKIREEMHLENVNTHAKINTCFVLLP